MEERTVVYSNDTIEEKETVLIPKYGTNAVRNYHKIIELNDMLLFGITKIKILKIQRENVCSTSIIFLNGETRVCQFNLYHGDKFVITEDNYSCTYYFNKRK